MQFGRIGSDRRKLPLVHPGRNSDREDFDSGVFRQLCFGQRLALVDVCGPIGYQKQKSANVLPRSTLFNKHFGPCSLQCTCYVRIAAVDVQYLQRTDDRIQLRVVVEVEHDIRLVAKLHQADLRLIRRDRKHLDSDGNRKILFNIGVGAHSTLG